MERAQILRALAETDGLPREALEAATAQRAELIPVFLGKVEAFLAWPDERPTSRNQLFFIFHLLGSWREKSAYRSLARLLRSAQIDDILGDATVSTSHRVIAAAFDGDPGPLYDIILDGSADEYVRSRMCEALAMLVLQGELDRNEAVRFLGQAFEAIKPQACCYVWAGWQSAIAMLGATTLTSLVKEAFGRGFVDETWLGFHHFESDLAFAIAHPGQIPSKNDGPYTLFGDTVAELSTWYAFSDEYRNDRKRRSNFDELPALFEPRVNQLRHVGRNDPCPCGSGKKFKKCCMV